jgi:exonuclease VII small subunit
VALAAKEKRASDLEAQAQQHLAEAKAKVEDARRRYQQAFG